MVIQIPVLFRLAHDARREYSDLHGQILRYRRHIVFLPTGAIMTDQPKHVFLIDGSGFLFRAFHALPPMTRDDGTPVNAVFGFTKMVMKLIDDTDADYIAVIFDRARKTFSLRDLRRL